MWLSGLNSVISKGYQICKRSRLPTFKPLIHCITGIISALKFNVSIYRCRHKMVTHDISLCLTMVNLEKKSQGGEDDDPNSFLDVWSVVPVPESPPGQQQMMGHSC